MNGLLVLSVLVQRRGADWVICDRGMYVNLKCSDEGTYLSLGGME